MANTGQYDSQTNIETEDYEREIFVRPEAAVIYGGSVVNSVNGQVGDVVLTTSDLENTSDYQTGAQVQSAIAGKQDRLTAGTNIQINNDVISATGTTYSAGSGLNLDGTTFSVDTNTIATVQDVTDEATIRENSDANLQGQIDALTVSSDVIDVLGTYQDLQNYDTSHVKANDIIKVLQDSTHNNSMSYYRWEITDHVGSWVYVGSEGPYYTKSEADALLDSKQNVIVDLPQIRSGAEAGATAVQPEDLARIATTGSYNDSLDKPSINNVELEGNKSLSDLGIVTLDEFYKAFPTDTASGAVASFTDGADDLPLKSLVVNINPVQDLHGQESPYPAGEGKNKFNGTFLQGYWAYANGTWVNSPNWITTEKIPCKASTSYTVSADTKMTRWQGFVWYDSNGDFISTDNLNSTVNIGLTKTSPSNAAYLIFNIAGYPGANDTIVPSDVTHFQLEEGSSSTAYAPYSNICPISGWTGMQLNANGTVIPISWQTEAGTVYGGTLDLVSGLLTVNRTTVNTTWGSGVNATNLGYVTRKRFNLGNPSKKYYTDAQNDLKSNVIGQYDTLYSGDYVHMYLASTTHIWAYMPSNTAADTVMQFSYTLGTPVTYQLTPTEVTTLLGDNTIWADTGDTEVEYRADTKLYINKMIGDAETISTRLASGGRETALYEGAINPIEFDRKYIETNIPLEEEGVEEREWDPNLGR